MVTNLIGNSSGALTASTDKFNGIYAFAQGWGTAITTQNVMPCAGTLQNFYILVDTANPSGKTFTIYKNGVDQALTITLGAGATTGNDTTHTVSFVAGDTISIHASGGDGVTNMAVVRWSIGANCATNVSMILSMGSGAMGTTFPVYIAPQGSNVDTTSQNNVETVMPTAGTIKNAYVQLNTVIGTGTNLTFTLFVNGSAPVGGPVIVVSALASSGNDLVGSVAVSPGDRLYWKVTTTVAPASKTPTISAEFDPTIDGESVHMYGNSKAQPTGTVQKFQTIGSGLSSASSTVTPEYTLTQTATWEKLYVFEQTSIATGSLNYQAIINGFAVGPTVTISSGQTGNDTVNTASSVVGGRIAMSITPTNPTVSLVEWGIVSFIAPIVATTVKQLSALGVG